MNIQVPQHRTIRVPVMVFGEDQDGIPQVLSKNYVLTKEQLEQKVHHASAEREATANGFIVTRVVDAI